MTQPFNEDQQIVNNAIMELAISKAEITMKAAAWQLQAQTEDSAALRKALVELAYVAEENGVYLSNLTKTTQDTIVAIRLGGYK